jgi:hypothetical protein
MVQRGPKVTSLAARGRCAQHLYDVLSLSTCRPYIDRFSAAICNFIDLSAMSYNEVEK